MPDISYEVYMKELQKVPNWNKKPNIALSNSEKKFIVEAYQKGATIIAIAKVLKRNRHTIGEYLNRIE